MGDQIMKTLLAVTTFAIFTSAGALADGPKATSTAAQHAGMAASSADLAGAQRHLHHVLNCLVGPEGEGFDAAAGNPCAAAGGAIAQTSDTEMKEKLQKAANQARAALAGTDADATRKVAGDIEKTLK
jgi:hypothetical protein